MIEALFGRGHLPHHYHRNHRNHHNHHNHDNHLNYHYHIPCTSKLIALLWILVHLPPKAANSTLGTLDRRPT